MLTLTAYLKLNHRTTVDSKLATKPRDYCDRKYLPLSFTIYQAKWLLIRSSTHIEPPGGFVDCWLGIYAALEVDVITLLDFVCIQGGSQPQLSPWHIYNVGAGDRAIDSNPLAIIFFHCFVAIIRCRTKQQVDYLKCKHFSEKSKKSSDSLTYEGPFKSTTALCYLPQKCDRQWCNCSI